MTRSFSLGWGLPGTSWGAAHGSPFLTPSALLFHLCHTCADTHLGPLLPGSVEPLVGTGPMVTAQCMLAVRLPPHGWHLI